MVHGVGAEVDAGGVQLADLSPTQELLVVKRMGIRHLTLPSPEPTPFHLIRLRHLLPIRCGEGKSGRRQGGFKKTASRWGPKPERRFSIGLGLWTGRCGKAGCKPALRFLESALGSERVGSRGPE